MLITTTAGITMDKSELAQFLDNLAEIEKLCGGRPDLAQQIHYIAQRFSLQVTEWEMNAVLCSNCGSIFCYVWQEEGHYYASCRVCDHREQVPPPSQEVIDFLVEQEKEDKRMDEEIYKAFKEVNNHGNL